MSRRKILTRVMTVAAIAVLATVMTGCISVTITPRQSEQALAAPYFEKGVYCNYSAEANDPPKTYFYVFNTEEYGHTDDGENEGMGLPFDVRQADGEVRFTFGSVDEDEDVLVITKAENGKVYGYFKDLPDRPLVFEKVPGLDADTFDAVNYLRAAAGEDLIYRDANGWSVRYDPNLFTINGGGPEVTFVYTGESAGTNMITASYNVDKDAKTAVTDLSREWGDKASMTEGTFPGTDDVEGYYLSLPPENEGSGLYSVAIARDYMDGYLLFELTGYNSGEEEADMAVSDALAGVIDSIEFTTYNE
ncbi:MAG: hypothetical protein K6F28_06535 [Lachnospiraceae bacterium]|nr:hypothetical protein [Lachnospiraceae bacterium]